MSVLPAWVNDDAVPHTVTTDDGACTITVPVGGMAWCERALYLFAGTYGYRVSDLVDPVAEIVVLPNERRVTMVAPRTTVRSGQPVVLHGTVFAASIAPFAGMNMPQRITVLRRMAGSRRFVVIRRVRSRDRAIPGVPCYCDPNENIWSTTIRPRATASYIARIVDPPETTIWVRAQSARVAVSVIAPPAPR